jgi:pyruvate dehydrogenase E2 component (dihydrolipoamide acetyltransferase)
MARLTFKTLGGHGPDLVLIHGFGADRLSWAGNVAALLPVARVHALDLPGHGESGPDVGSGTVTELASRVAETLTAQGIAKPHLLGHSLGGAIAMELAVAAPERVASLALIAPAGLGCGLDHDFLARYPELAAPEETAALLGRLVNRPMLINKFTVQHVLTQLSRPGTRDALRRIAGALQAGEGQIDQTAMQIAETVTPRLVVWGGLDGINPPDQARLSAFGGKTLFVPDAGHLPHIEAARLVNAELSAFIMGANDDG